MKCGSKVCTSTELAYRVHWPGKSLDFCFPCAVRAARVANAMGVNLAADPINADGTPNPDGRSLTVALALVDLL